MKHKGLNLNTTKARDKYRKDLSKAEDYKVIKKDLRDELGWDYSTQHRYYQEHKDKIAEAIKKYRNRPEIKAKLNAYQKKWKQEHRSVKI